MRVYADSREIEVRFLYTYVRLMIRNGLRRRPINTLSNREILKRVCRKQTLLADEFVKRVKFR